MREIDEESPANVGVLEPELEELEQTRASLRSRINKLRYGTQDSWEGAYIEIEEACDMTAMVDEALKASGFTGKEKQYRELPW
jgi:cell division protein FtsB